MKVIIKNIQLVIGNNKFKKFKLLNNTHWLFLFFFLHPILAKTQVSTYTETHYDFTDIILENQGAKIEKDIFGFYWIITNNGYILRWNGIDFKLMYNPVGLYKNANENIYNCIKDYNSKLVFYGNNNVVHTPKDNWVLKKIDTNEVSMKYAVRGGQNFIELQKIWPAIKKNNSVELVNALQKTLNDFSETRGSFYVAENSFYIVSIDNVIYCHNNIITVIPFDESFKQKTVFCIGKYLVCLWGEKYEIFLDGKKIKESTNKNLKSILQPNVRVFSGINAAYATVNATGIYRFSIVNNDVLIENYAQLPLLKIGVNALYVDEVFNRILILAETGGLSVFEKKYFKSQFSSSKDQKKSIVYSLLHTNKKVYSNVDFQKKGEIYSYDYYTVSPIAILPNGDFIYFSFYRSIAHFDEHLNLKNILGSSIEKHTKSIVVLDDKLIVPQNGKLVAYNYKSNKFDKVLFNPGLINSESIGYICAGPSGVIFAEINNVVYQIDIKNKTRKKIVDLKKYDQSLKHISYSSEYNGLFISMNLIGLFFYDLSNGILKQFPVNDFWPLMSCHYVLKDNGGDYWLPTNNGLYLMLKKELDEFIKGSKSIINYYRFGRERGIENLEFNGGFTNSGICVGDSVFLSSMSGIVSFSASKVKENFLGISKKSKIFVLSFADDDLIKEVGSTIELQPGFKRCVIKYDFSYANSPNAILEYQVIGIGDSTWQLLPTKNEILLRGLKAGIYFIKVRVQNNNTVPTSVIKLFVKQYWYLSTLAYSIYAVLLFLMLYIFYNWRVNVLKSRSLLEIDKNRRQLFAIVSHDLRSPLKAYQGMADMVSYLLKRGDYGRIEKVAAQIDDTGAKLELLLKNLLNWNLLEQQKLLVKKQMVDVVKLIEELLPLYRDIASHRNISIVLHRTSLDSALVATDEAFFSLIVRNLLDNAVKNAPAGSVMDLYVVAEARGMAFRFENAIGKEQGEKLQVVAGLFNGNNTWEPGTQGMGMGLKMVKLAVQKLGGTASVTINNSRVVWNVVL